MVSRRNGESSWWEVVVMVSRRDGESSLSFHLKLCLHQEGCLK